MSIRLVTYAVLGALAGCYLVAVLSAPPLIGIYHDDGIYIGTAISLAGGEGFRIPHLPANPYQAKYPPLFPLLLTPVAWATGASPAHGGLSSDTLAAFRWPVVVTALGALALLPGLFRRWGMGERAALAATALTGLSPLVLQHGFHVMSEAPFLLLTVATFRLLPGPDDDRDAGRLGRRWAGAAACAVASVLCRTVGVALVPALLAAAWPHRRDWRAWTPAAAATVAFVAWSAAAAAMRSAETARELGPFYDYYIGYGSWIRTAPDQLWHVASMNLMGLLVGFGDHLLGGRVMGLPERLWIACDALVGAVVLFGSSRLPRTSLPAACYVGASLLLFLVWPFPVGRFLIPLTPFAVWGGWKAATLAVGRFRLPARFLPVAAGLCIASCAVADWIRFPAPGQLPLLGGHVPTADFEASARWLVEHTNPDDLVLSTDDPWVWLATGRPSITPGVLDPLWKYLRPEPSSEPWNTSWRSEFIRFEAEARRLGARWLLFSPSWDRHFGAIWQQGVATRPRRYVPRFETGPPQQAFVIYEMR